MHVRQSSGITATLGDLATDERTLYRQLHALALAIYQAKQRANMFQAAGNVTATKGQIDTVVGLRRLFEDVARRFVNIGTTTPTFIDRMILATDAWVSASLKALPKAVVAIAAPFVEGVGEITKRAGFTLIGALAPWLVIGLGLVWFLGRAEKTRTVRRLVG